MTQTSNLGLYKPDSTDLVDVSVLNNNMDILDSDVKPDAVRYDTAQTLTSGQQAQGRSNIGAAAAFAEGGALLTGATSIPSNSDLNSYATPGTYYSGNSTVSATLSNTPITSAGFTLFVLAANGGGNYRIQYAITNTNEYRRTSADGGSTWVAWVKTYPLTASDVNAVSTSVTNGSFTFRAGYTTNSDSFIKKQGNVVSFILNLTSSQSISAGSTNYFVTFPSGFRPTTGTTFVGQAGGGTINSYYVGTNGQLYALNAVGNGVSIRICGSYIV